MYNLVSSKNLTSYRPQCALLVHVQVRSVTIVDVAQSQFGAWHALMHRLSCVC